jgi:hypothetical protein
MSLRNRTVGGVIAFFVLVFLAGCGSSSNTATPPPSGGFSNSNLKGTYVFSMVGSDSTANNNFLAIAGTFAANGTGGNGGITDGTLDINDAGLTAPATNIAITGGTYAVTSDGRGQATLVAATPFGTSLKVDFVLTSSGHGLITEFDGFGTGSGSLDLQSSTSQPAAGTYVMGLSGISGINTLTGGGIPVATAGGIALDASGVASGSMDYNNNETTSNLTINSGSMVSAGTPGKATLVTSGGTFNFDVFPIDSTHMKFIEVETGSAPILSGDLFSQTSSNFPSGVIAFSMAGLDYGASPATPLAVGGLMTSDGTTISNGEEDFNDSGTADTSPQAFTGTITPSGARFAVQLSTFENGAAGTTGTFTFAAYPSSGGIELVEIDGSGVTAGVAFSQSSTTLASSQGYGFNLTAANSSNFEEDDIAEFTTTSSGFSGLIDINDQGQTNFDQRFSGTYTLDSPATGRGVLTSNLLNGAFYVVDSSDVLFIETDNSQLGVGAFQMQSASAKSSLTASHFAMLRLKPGAKKALKSK